jgi:hypothetical protein
LRARAGWLAAFVLWTTSSAHAANVPGTSAQFVWGAATGPVAGYAVQVSRSGGVYREETRVASTSARVAGQIGETIRVRVLAYDVTGRLGPASAISDAITFVQPPAPPPATRVDLDGNGLADAIAVSPATGAVAASLLQSDGSRRWVAIGAPRDAGMRPVGLADADGDGRKDLLLRNAASGANELWLLRGLTYSVVALPIQGVRFRAVAFRDFSADGKADVLFHDTARGESIVWRLGANGFLGVLPVDPAPAGATLAAVADVDGDRAPDLLWQRSATRALDAWLLRGVEPRAVLALGILPVGSRIDGVGDLDANGTDDLVIHVETSTSIALHAWFLAGTSAPRKAIARHLLATSRLRGVVDVNSDGRDDLVIASSTALAAYGVTPVLAATSPPRWTSNALALNNIPTGSWQFLSSD